VLNAAIAAEKEMVARDNEIRATHDMRNSLEAYIYATRSALEESLAQYVDAAGRETVSSELNEAESWLYGDGFDADKATLEGRRKALVALAAPLHSRKWEADNRYDAVQNLVKLIEDFRGVADNATGRHAHLSDSDRDSLRSACKEAEAFLKEKQAAQAARELSQDPAFKVAEVAAAKDRLVRELTPIANKPVPLPPAPAPAAAAAPDVPMPPAGEAPAAAAAEPAAAGQAPMQE
jgi:heat shock protein 4